MKLASNISVGLFVAWVLLAIIDMWFDIVSWEVFIKATITLGLLAILGLIVAIAKRK